MDQTQWVSKSTIMTQKLATYFLPLSTNQNTGFVFYDLIIASHDTIYSVEVNSLKQNSKGTSTLQFWKHISSYSVKICCLLKSNYPI